MGILTAIELPAYRRLVRARALHPSPRHCRRLSV